jgi:hypothetical protein
MPMLMRVGLTGLIGGFGLVVLGVVTQASSPLFSVGDDVGRGVAFLGLFAAGIGMVLVLAQVVCAVWA